MGLFQTIASFLGMGDPPLTPTSYRTTTSASRTSWVPPHGTAPAAGEAIPRGPGGPGGSAGGLFGSPLARFCENGVAVPGNDRALWLGKGASLSCHGYRISSPLIYIAHGSAEHPAFVNPRSHVGPPYAMDPGYWPSWDGLSEGNRGAWLAWLRDGRRQPRFNIGLVFLYFYGLERRALIERADLPEIYEEVIGLLGVYGSNRSFHGYACGLLATLHIMERSLPVEVTIAAMKTPPPQMSSAIGSTSVAPLPGISVPSELLEVLLTLSKGPLDAGLAAAVCLSHPKATRSPAIKQVWGDFSALFATRFEERWPQGLAVPDQNRPKLTLEYRWAGHFAERPARRLTYPSSLTHPTHWDPLIDIWNQCVRDLRKLATMAKEGNADQRARFAALPAELRDASNHPDYAVWEAWFRKAQGPDGYSLVAISELVIRAALPCPVDGKLRPSSAKQLAERLEHLGFAIEPDPRFTGKALSIMEQRIIYRPASGVVVTPGIAYRGLQTIVELCIAVAIADGEITEDEATQIFGLLDRDDELPEPERERLLAHVAYQQRVKGDIAAITAARLGKVSTESRTVIASMVVAIALADGVVTKDEVDALRKVYRALGLPKDRLEKLLTSQGDDETIQEQGQNANAIGINWQAVEQLQRETNDVQHLLGKALAECARETDADGDRPTDPSHEAIAEADAVTPTTSIPDPTNDSASVIADHRFTGLDSRFHRILGEFVSKRQMTHAEFRAICTSEGLMPEFTIECINTWSDTVHGDFLIESSVDVRISSDVLKKISHD